MHYNTTGATADQRALLNRNTAMQEQRILAHMKANRMQPFTAEEIEREFGLPRTSVSRALCNLTKDGAIRKSSSARWKSSFGRACYAWRAE